MAIVGADVISTPRSESARADAVKFLAAAAGWNLLFFAVLRTDWFVTHAGLPFAALQQAIATWYSGGSTMPVTVSMACSGTDVMALSAGVILAYPATIARRLQGVAIALPVLLLLNLVRIDTLALTATSPTLFTLLHLYVWPVVLVVAAAAVVFQWMRSAGAVMTRTGQALSLGIGGLGAFAIATPLLASSALITPTATFVVGAAARVLHTLGAEAVANGPLLTTPRGAFIVTADCLLSPIIPLWIVAVLWWPLGRWQRLAGLALTVPVMAALAIARLFVLAAPGAWVTSPLILVHGFHQLVFFAALVIIASAQSALAGGPLAPAVRRGLGAVIVSALVAVLAGGLYNAALAAVAQQLSALVPHALITWWQPGDVQGALVLLPMYQLALFGALLSVADRPIAWSRAGVSIATLVAAQIGLLLALGELATHWVWHPHALLVRAVAVALPVALAVICLRGRVDVDRRERDAAYRGFWDHVGAEFPDLGGAASTAFYAANEQRLIAQHLPPLSRLRVLKTDLWDEARNTRILQWMQRQGARVSGIDISGPVIRMARREFRGAPFTSAGADVRALPFADRSFDAIYSMGTVEHFPETDAAIAECFRVVRPGGRVVMGVPNRHDPFLRPLLVELLYRTGLYDYGFEKSYSRRALRRMMETAGFTVVGDDGILFIPGWLRMLDLLCHTRMPAFTRITAAGVHLFEWIDAHLPAVRRHGYLIVAVGERPHETVAARPPLTYSSEGFEWLVDAHGCDPAILRSRAALESLFADIIAASGLTPIGSGQWHVFDGAGGVTGLQMLRESHIACHTYPEAGYAAVSLYCCRPEPVEWPWRERLASALGATGVSVRVITRGPSAAATTAPIHEPSA